jgi:hypothetical protein
MISRRVGRRARLFVVGTITTWLAVTPAMASNFGSDFDNPCDATILSQCVSENNVITYHYYSVGSAMTWASDQMFSYYNGTDLVILSTSGTGELRVFDESYPTLNKWGFTLCTPSIAVYGGNPATHTAWCRPQDIVYNTHYTASWGSIQQRYLACHEIGHTFGLRHYNDDGSCMKDGDLTGAINVTLHEIGSHLNVRY